MGLAAWFAVFLVLGTVFGWVSFFRTSSLKREVQELQKDVRRLQMAQLSAESKAVKEAPAPMAAAPQIEPERSMRTQPESPIPQQASPQPAPGSLWKVERTAPPSRTKHDAVIYEHLREHWMSWLGGICIGLAGIFLVRYSMEQGLLGPTARVVAGLISGIGLHAAALWLRLRKGVNVAFAALAAGGSITLFAAVLAALHLYTLFTPLASFIALAIVALATMWLALLHGPVLAGLGILGAYAVPALVGGDSGSAHTVLAYALIISAAGLALLRHVDRVWLWGGVYAGTAIWWLFTFGAEEADRVRGWYLASFVWLIHAIPDRDWLLRRRCRNDSGGLSRFAVSVERREGLQCLGVAGALAAWTLSMASSRFYDASFFLWTPFAVLVLVLAGKREYLSVQAWLLLAAAWLASYGSARVMDQMDPRLPAFYWYCLGMTGVFVLMALRNLRLGDWRVWQPMALLVPLGFLLLAWFKTANAELSLQWPLLSATLGGMYLAMATHAQRREWPALAIAWFLIATHAAYSLAVALYLREATLTLALAAQIFSLSWLIRRYDLPVLGWILKGIVMLVICRLSLNPWLPGYPSGMHWSLWTYGGATLFCWLGSRELGKWPLLGAWAHAAALHLLVLTLWAELRWWLYDGNVFAEEYTAIEAAINMCMFAVVGLMYHWRAQFSAHLAWLLRLYAQVLLVLALGNYLLILTATLAGVGWIVGQVGRQHVFNSTLLFYALPSALSWAVARFYVQETRNFALFLSAFSAFVWISLQIRHLWHFGISLRGGTIDSELYTYSAVWLVLAVLALLGGAWRFGQAVYRGGMALLLLVIVKLFLIDMDDLQGLLRVTSFLGMGLALLAVAYLHKRLQPDVQAPSSNMSTGM